MSLKLFPAPSSGGGLTDVDAGTGLEKTGTAANPILALTPEAQASLAKADSIGTAASRNVGTTNGNVVEVGAGDKIASSLLPAIAITETWPVASEAEMLALAATVGHVAVRSDTSETYILAAEPATVLANWQKLLSPGTVVSVNGQTGAVVLTAATVGASPTNHTHAELHTHANATVLGAIGDIDGALTYNGAPVGGSGGGSTPVAFVGARVSSTVPITLTTAVATTLSFNVERYDTDNMFDPAQPDRLVCRVAGYYEVTAQMIFAGTSGTGTRSLTVTMNGTTNVATRNQAGVVSPNVTGMSINTAPFYMNVGDYVQVKATQSSGGNLDITVSGMQSPEFSLVKVG